MLKELVIRNRSYRRFYQEVVIESHLLKDLIELARLSPSAANLQHLRYILSFREKTNRLIFPYLLWAGYLKDWSGPPEGERPSAYIIIVGDKEISPSFGCDPGIAAQSILLGAVERGLGGCIIGSIDREGLRKSLKIQSQYEILLAIAVGKPKERIVIEKIDQDGDVKYWRDSEGIHHVPKRALEDIIMGQGSRGQGDRETRGQGDRGKGRKGEREK